MSGVIVDGKPHLHATVADESQAWGGHLEPGCRVLYLAEVFLVEFWARSSFSALRTLREW